MSGRSARWRVRMLNTWPLCQVARADAEHVAGLAPHARSASVQTLLKAGHYLIEDSPLDLR
jgi:hypothetical protein